MALTYDDAMTALRNADAAGDTGAAQQLAGIAAKLRDQRAAPATPAAPPKAVPETPGTPQGYAGRVAAIPGVSPEWAAGRAPAQTRPAPTFVEKAKGAVEAALNTVDALVGGSVGMAGGFLGGLAGAAEVGMRGGVQPQGGIEQAAMEGAERGTRFLQGSPARAAPTPIGQEYTEEVGETLVRHGPSVIGIGPELGMLGKTMGPAARALGDVGVARVAKAAEAKATAAKLALPELEGIRAAHDAGYKLTPKAAKAGLGARVAETSAGSARLSQELAAHNAENTARLARKDVGLPEDVPATPEATAKVRKEAGQDYAAVQDVGRFENDAQYGGDLDAIVKPYLEGGEDFSRLAKNPIIKEIEGLRVDGADTGSAISVVKDLRNEADKAFRAGDKNLGNSYRAAAAAVDNSMDRALGQMAERSGVPELAEAVDKYRAARVRIAKTYLLDDAMDGKPGEVNAKAYGRALDKGAKLSGPGLQIAQFAKQFGEEGLAAKKGKAGAVGPTYHDILLGALLHVPTGAAAMIARPAARAALGSKFMQRRMAGTKPARAVAEPPVEPPPSGAGPAGEPPIPVGEATEITPQVVEPAGVPALDPRLAEIERLKTSADSDAVRAALDEHAKTVQKDIAVKTAAAKQTADVRALERAAKTAEDPALRVALQAKADKLRAEKIPVGETKELATTPTPPVEKPGKIPVGKVIEGQPELPVAKAERIPVGQATELPIENLEPAPAVPEPIPVGEATEVQPIPAGAATEMIPVGEATEVQPIPVGKATEIAPEVIEPAQAPEYAHTAMFAAAEKRGIETRGRRPSEVRTAVENAVIKEHKLNPFEAERAKAVAKALDIDEKAVENAAVQHERSPRMFDKAIDRIIEQGGENAPETKQAAGSREGAAAEPPPERAAGATPAATEQPGANRPATPRTASEGNQPGGQGETPVAPRGFEKGAQKKSEIAHQDPGQPTEPVTPKVVAASLGKNAKPVETRAALLKSIDDAIAKAPEMPVDIGTTPPRTVRGKQEFAGVRGSLRVDVREGSGGLWHVQDMSLPVTERARNAEIVQADGPQAARVAVERLLARAEMTDGKIVYGTAGTVSFKVPGDGEFKVLNERGRLAEFRAKVEKSPGFSNTGQRTQSAPEPGKENARGSSNAVSAVTNMIEEGDFEAARDYAEHKGVNLDDVKLNKFDSQRLKDWLIANPQQLD